ncbi:phospholipase D family protein [Marivita sp. S6314]|uniref:phospholipase D family protein n=1 Tax=Marivita sp. S6314 TaxID=2926406 RepID=UPI001FF267A1|nr:phospholipase D family protein [Marivita sp. S6314]
MRFVRLLLVLTIVATLAIVTLRILNPLPDLPSDNSASAIPLSADTSLGNATLGMIAEHDGHSGVVPLFDGRDALAARILLARAAEQSIDVQYYIWQTDTTGWLLLDELRAAAERGVRVRMLLDDNGIPGLDSVLAELNTLPNMDIRIFNPFTLRKPKLLSYGFDFFRLNRRMHNKSMTVDGAATIIGGRNIGDIYFAYGDGVTFIDLDVLAVGQAAVDVSENFDAYWTSGSSYAAKDVLPASTSGLDELATAAKAARAGARGSGYIATIKSSPLMSSLLDGTASLEWTDVTLVSDDPSKGLGDAGNDDLLIGRLPALLTTPVKSVDVISAYLIPGKKGAAMFEGYAQNGIRTRLMTNSMAANDVMPVHGAWMGYRDQMVRAGVEVFELRSQQQLDSDTTLAQMLTGSQSSLHAKTFAIDEERIFIGSFNFDPRSAQLNTEMGFLIESPTIATALARSMDDRNTVYAVTVGPDGNIQWEETLNTGEIRIHHKEPNTTFLERAFVTLISWLPVEWAL